MTDIIYSYYVERDETKKKYCMNGHYRLWKNLMQKKSKESEEIITMIIDNVKVYTESGNSF